VTIGSFAKVEDRRRAVPFQIALPVGGMAFMALFWLLLYFVPTLAVAVEADTPGFDNADFLSRVGLKSTDLTASDATMTSSGVRVRLVGVYADSIRTVIVVQSEYGLIDPLSTSLTDQFWRQYTVHHARGDSRFGTEAMTFPALEPPTRVTGARIHLTATRLINGSQSTAGRWTWDGVVLPKTSSNLSLEPAHIGQQTVTFETVVRSGSSLLMVVRVAGPRPTPPALAPGSKPMADVSAVLVGPSETYRAANIEEDGEDGATKLTITWVGVQDGKYRLELTLFGTTTMREIALGR
jgi:hypothetical protein